MIFLENLARPILFLHLASAFALIGSMTHNLIVVIGYCRGRFVRRRQERLYVKISFWLYTAVFGLGALIYPVFRIRVRAEYFDQLLPAATGLFEAKEHWAAIGWAMFAAYYLLSRNFQPKEEKEKLFFYVPLCFLLHIMVWYMVIASFYLTTLEAV